MASLMQINEINATGPIGNVIEILYKLMAFENVSGRHAHHIIEYICSGFTLHSVEVSLSFNKARQKANIFAKIGPHSEGDVVSNGHTDVVPVEARKWATYPFKLTGKDYRLYGRGSVGMKGFLTCFLASVSIFKSVNLKNPIHAVWSYDDETGVLVCQIY